MNLAQQAQAEVAQRSRDLVEQSLRAGTQIGSPIGFLRAIQQNAAEKRTAFDWTAALTFWWELCRIGAVAIVGGGDPTVFANYPHFIVTERGRRMLEKKDASPHHAERYLDAVRKRVRVPDPIAMDYLEEAAGAWRAGLNRSSIVTLGCACERLILLLAESVRDGADLEPWSTTLRKMLAGTKPAGISEVFKQVREAVTQGAKLLPGDLSDTVERTLTPT
ncbi:MAG: hypothetical protein ACRENE_29530, partial [Polyangiaceae bacterium]